jgi:tetratricopeptide (TPR) repeat protein
MDLKEELFIVAAFFALLTAVPTFAQTPQQDLLKSAFMKLALNKDLDGAIADCTAAIKIDPKYEAAYRARANMQTQKGDYAAAVTDFTTLIGLSPNSVEYYGGRGDAYVKLGQNRRLRIMTRH